MKKNIWLDMDRTIANLYGVKGWLEMLRSYSTHPYVVAEPLVRMSTLARLLNNRRKMGYRVCILSALSKDSTNAYDTAVMKAKLTWLKKHLPSVRFDEIRFVPYDYEKNDANHGDDILFDDEARHLNAWTGTAIPACYLIEGLKNLVA